MKSLLAQGGRWGLQLLVISWFVAGIGNGPVAHAADLSAREVAQKLFKAGVGERVDFSDRNLSLTDLSHLDFKAALLTGADLYGTDLTDAKLVGADLSETRLDRATIIRTDFSKANLTDATLLRPTTFTNDAFDTNDAARFSGARLVRLRVHARLDGANFRGADLTEADFSPLDLRSGTISTKSSSQLPGADFSDAVLRGVNLSGTNLVFAKFRNVDAAGADFHGADLTGADFTGADISGVDFTGANLTEANFEGVRGLQSARGVKGAQSVKKETP